MPNAHSKAGHIPQRTCVICRQKKDQGTLLSFFTLGTDIVYDIKNRVNIRKQYVCPATDCLTKVDVWMVKRNKKRTAHMKG